MKARVRIFDHSALTHEELIQRIKAQFNCSDSDIEVMPDSNKPIDHIYFGIQQLITADQLDILFQEGALYHDKLEALRRATLEIISAELDRVIIDNEAKILG